MRCWTILHLNYYSVFFCGYFYVIMLSASISKRLLQRMKFLLCLSVEYIFQTRKQWLTFFPESWNLDSSMAWASCWSLLILISHFCVQCPKKYFKWLFCWVGISISVSFAVISFTILLYLLCYPWGCNIYVTNFLNSPSCFVTHKIVCTRCLIMTSCLLACWCFAGFLVIPPSVCFCR